MGEWKKLEQACPRCTIPQPPLLQPAFLSALQSLVTRKPQTMRSGIRHSISYSVDPPPRSPYLHGPP